MLKCESTLAQGPPSATGGRTERHPNSVGFLRQ
jgi:hypothetical protein